MLYDLLVLGGSPGGYNAALRAAQAGLLTVLIEQSSLGGVCLNEGCVPSKTLLHAAKLYDYARGESAKYGVTCDNARLDHIFVLRRKHAVITELTEGLTAQMRAANVQIVTAPGTIAGRAEGGFRVEAGGAAFHTKRLLIATGSKALLPPIPGLKDCLETGSAITSREILNLGYIPKTLAVIGGGVIGLEMAAYYSSAGAKVTVVELIPQIAGGCDVELASQLQACYVKKGVVFELSARVTQIRPDGIVFEQGDATRELRAEKALLSIGRQPVSEGFGLESLGVFTDHGAIAVDDRCRTSIAGVYAVGDCTGRSMLSHAAYRQGDVAVSDILGTGNRYHAGAIPAVIYTNPELAAVGMTEAAARNQGFEIRVVKLPMRYSGRFAAENADMKGLFKLVFDKRRNVLIGAHALGNPASEFIAACAMMIERQMTPQEIRQVVFPHPTVCEIIREAALHY